MFKAKIILSLVLLILTTSTSWAANKLPEHYPDQFQNEGVLQDIKRGKLIINATAYGHIDNVVVHTLKTNYGSLNNLHKDMEIAFQILYGNIISEIWILPKGYVELD